MIYLGVAGSAAVHCLWWIGLRHLESIEVAALGTVMPFTGMAFTIVFLNESLTPGQILSGFLIIPGLIFSIQKQALKSQLHVPIPTDQESPASSQF